MVLLRASGLLSYGCGRHGEIATTGPYWGAMSEWTLVADTPPPVGVNVLGWDAEHRMSDEVRIVWLRDGDTASDPWRIDDDSGTSCMHVTHWMPLPAPPDTTEAQIDARLDVGEILRRDASD